MSELSPEVQRHWVRTRNTSFVILAIWFVFSFVVHWFAADLNKTTFLDFPLGFYFAAQGSLAIFVVLIFVHNWLQDKIDEEAGLSSDEES